MRRSKVNNMYVLLLIAVGRITIGSQVERSSGAPLDRDSNIATFQPELAHMRLGFDLAPRRNHKRKRKLLQLVSTIAIPGVTYDSVLTPDEREFWVSLYDRS